MFMLWLGGAIVLYALHLPQAQDWYHDGALHYVACFVFILPPPGIAVGCVIFIVWLWTITPSRLTLLHAFCLTVLAICVAIPLLWASGVVFVLIHLAP